MGFQRSHNRKSVKPFCNIHTSMNAAGINISVMNAGLGPMIIKKIVLLKKKEDAAGNGIQLPDLLPPDLHYDVIVNKKDSYILPAMGEMNIFQFRADSGTAENRIEQLRNTFEGHYLSVVFKDIYDHYREKREILKF